MKRLTILLTLILMLSISLISCTEDTADDIERRKTIDMMKEAQSQIGMPNITNWQEKRLAKMIFELRDQENLRTYTYIVTMTGKKVFLGRSIGYGLPYSIQYTNPMRLAYRNGSRYKVPQADPNGLFMPSGLSATWVMLIDKKTNKARPVYVENEIVVSPFKLH